MFTTCNMGSLLQQLTSGDKAELTHQREGCWLKSAFRQCSPWARRRPTEPARCFISQSCHDAWAVRRGIFSLLACFTNRLQISLIATVAVYKSQDAAHTSMHSLPALGNARASQGHKNWVLCLAWSPDGEMVASGGMEGVLWLWDPKTGKPLGRCKGAATASASLVNSYLFLRTAPSQTKALGHACISTVREVCYGTEGCTVLQGIQNGSQPSHGSPRMSPCQRGALSAAQKTQLSRYNPALEQLGHTEHTQICIDFLLSAAMGPAASHSSAMLVCQEIWILKTMCC